MALFCALTVIATMTPCSGQDEKRVFEIVHSTDEDQIREFKHLVSKPKFNVNAVDEEGRTLLVIAAYYNHLVNLKLLLEKKADPNRQLNEAWELKDIPITFACSKEAAMLFVKHGADLKIRNARGENALGVFLNLGEYEIADYLISKGLNVNDQDLEGMTLLMRAAQKGNMDTACYLLSQKANLRLKNAAGQTAADLAVKHHHKQMIKLLSGEIALRDQMTINRTFNSMDNRRDPVALVGKWIREGKLDPDMRLIEGTPILIRVLLWNWHETAKLLIAQGADVNIRDGRGMTSLFYARTLDMAHALLKQGARTDLLDNQGESVLFSAETKEMAALLIEHGADITVRSSEGQTPLFRNKSGDHTEELFDYMISQGCPVDQQDNKGNTALMNAVSMGDPGMVRILLKKGADRLLVNHEGKKAMDLISPQSHPEIVNMLQGDQGALAKHVNDKGLKEVESLLSPRSANVDTLKRLLGERQMDVNTVDSRGISLLMYACKCQKPDCVQFLIAQGADVNACDMNLVTALMMSAKAGSREIVGLLLAAGADPDARDKWGKTASEYVLSANKATGSQIVKMIEKARDTAKSPGR